MKTQGINNKRVIAFILSFLLVMQQSLAYQALAATSITNADGSVIKPNAGDNTWNIGPDAVNGQIGFKQFNEMNLSKGDILNFIYSYINQQNVDVTWNAGNNTHSVSLSPGAEGVINTFVALVNQGANINGIVNALQEVGGALKTDGNLMIVSPNGMVVGASGVLNVGSLSVITPTQNSYDALSNYLNLPTRQEGRLTSVKIIENDPVTEGKYTLDKQYSDSVFVANNIDRTFDPSTLQAGNGSVLALKDGSQTGGNIDFQSGSRVAARGDVNLQGGQVNANGLIVAGLGRNHTEALTGEAAANELFTSLVNIDNMGSANTFVNNNGNIEIKSVTGTSVGGQIRNYGSGNITITNEGSNGINIAGGIANPNGNVTVTNKAGELLVDTTGIVKNKGTMTFTNDVSGTKLTLNGNIENTGDMTVTNASGEGLLVAGNVTNNDGALVVKNTSGELLVDTTGIINSNGASTLSVTNEATGGMNVKGIVNINHDTKENTVHFVNKNSDMKLGSAGKNNNINSNADVAIQVMDGNLLNNGVENILIATSNNADLNIDVQNGSVGTEVGPNDGVYTGIGQNHRDLTKSVNVSVDGDITAVSSGSDSIVNLASLNKDMKINKIKADGRVILLADSTTKGSQAFDVLNAEGKDKSVPSVEGKGISIIASGNIGKSGDALTFRQGNANVFYGDDARDPHVPTNVNEGQYGVDMLAIKDINIKGLDGESGEKLDTNIGGLISREGSINAEFSGDVYVRETTAAKRIDLTTRGKNMYIEHLGEVPTYSQDYYGPNTNIHPEKAKLTALDLGSYWDESEAPEYEHAADSTIVVKNGTLKGQGNDGNGRFDEDGNVIHEQDLTLVADNAYAGGYYFNMGKHRGENKVSTVTKDPFTNKLDNASEDNDADISIRGKAVRPDDVEGIGQDPEDRNYYYGGSSQGGDEGYDGVNGGNDGDKQGTEEDDDNLVVPEEDEDVVPLDTDTDTDSDTDTDVDTDTDSDTDTDTDIDNDTDNDNDNDNDDDTDTDNDTDTDTDTDVDTDNDNDTDSDSDSDNDNDTDSDSDTDTDNDDDTDSDNDTDTDTDADSDPDPEPEPEPTPEPNINYDFGKELYKQRVVSDRVDSIDKRQFMRFDAQDNQNPITFDSSTDGVVSITDISRGGVSLTHNKKLKVGDVVPVHIQYGDLTINANVKIVSASDVKAGGKFIDLDQATANKLLYLSLIEKNEPIVQSVQQTISTTVEE